MPESITINVPMKLTKPPNPECCSDVRHLCKNCRQFVMNVMSKLGEKLDQEDVQGFVDVLTENHSEFVVNDGGYRADDLLLPPPFDFEEEESQSNQPTDNDQIGHLLPPVINWNDGEDRRCGCEKNRSAEEKEDSLFRLPVI